VPLVAQLGDVIVRRAIGELGALAWTLGGTGLVLITLSGETLKWGIWISGASLALHALGWIADANGEGDDQ
jgi:hypothetical protein